jgi:hypothetical protein
MHFQINYKKENKANGRNKRDDINKRNDSHSVIQCCYSYEVRQRLWTATTNRPIVYPPDDECGEHSGMMMTV